jgi:hypothetical protein
VARTISLRAAFVVEMAQRLSAIVAAPATIATLDPTPLNDTAVHLSRNRRMAKKNSRSDYTAPPARS